MARVAEDGQGDARRHLADPLHELAHGDVEGAGDVRVVPLGLLADGAFTTWYLKDGVVKAALTFGRSDDLDHARRLLADGSGLSETHRAALGNLDADLSSVGA